MTPPPAHKKFLIIASICCFLSALTTIGIHSGIFSLGDLTTDERMYLFQNPTYLFSRFWTIFHCLLVLISMWGFFLVQYKKAPGFMGLGFVFFTVFSFTEIFRQMLSLFYLNNLRRAYLEAATSNEQTFLELSMQNLGLLGYALFGLFIVCFALGCICYGLGLLLGDKMDKVLSYLLIFWGVGNLLAFANEFWQIGTISTFIEYLSNYYQPLIRVVIGLWLWKRYKLSQ